ncbi:MobF family relaxase [Actinokineospora sp. UTMC 2448]|uniref:MobF family relaxase n=1 Tax=Actinokineospora sp. UTMC 2448 TaxID=2268449 RepID=UPI002164B2C4|nr:MobF family relaxase [Actinokineospora sp. UTMC 2448]UVS80586.1 Multifunctional conjugation protein TraI [Actinokineospora sp. UTMC 2448]
MMVCHVLHAGDGYTYLTRQVATDDVPRRGRDPLVEYYQARGNRPGQWVGSGCGDLGMRGVVTEEQMLALFGEGLRPDANEFIAARMAAGLSYRKALAEARLGRRFYQFRGRTVRLADKVKDAFAAFETDNHRRASVQERREIIEATARKLLVQDTRGRPAPSAAEVRRYITDELGRAPQPVAGFDLVFSPVKSVSVLWGLSGHEIRAIVEQVHEDAWRAALAYGEREAAFTRVGAGGIAFVPTSGFVATAFQHRDSRAGDPDLHTHVAVSNRVLAADGRWRTIDSKQLHKVAVSMSETYNALVEQGLVERLGVRFVDVERGPGKRPVREIAGIPEQWIRGFSRRREQVEIGYEALVRDYVRRHGHTPPRSVQIRLAQQATLTDRPEKTELKTLAEQVAGWRDHARHLLPGTDIDAALDRCLHRTPQPAATTDLDAIAAQVVANVSEDRAHWTIYHVRAEAHRLLREHDFPAPTERLQAAETVAQLALHRHSVLLDIDTDPTPRLLRRPDGDPVFHRRGADRFTSEALLRAEQRLLDAALTHTGPVVGAAVRDRAIRRFETAKGLTLNPGQRALVEHFVSTGTALAVAIGPPGTGKSTAMGAVHHAWETTGGRVIGLAPSAAAASVLGDELGVPADTIHRLLHAHTTNQPLDIRRGDMLLVDEAGMAGTRLLDEVRQLAHDRGAVVRLIGDYRQLAAIEAGGALRLIHQTAGGVELSEVHRFRHPDEAQAVLRLRVGDARAIDFYADNNRLVGGVRAAALDRLYQDWITDITGGNTAIMISDSTEVVRELSARAQTDRRAAGLAEPGGAPLHDGTVAGIGDHIVTRKNRRRLTVHGGHDHVKNGDLWQVSKRYADGRLRVQHLRHGGTVLLPAWYVAHWVELGYAATVHRSQGLNVDISRSFLTPTATREAALVALSRGTHSNHAYLDTEQLLHPDEPHTLPGDLYYRHRETTPAEQALHHILNHEGAELSATETLREALHDRDRLSTIVPQYEHALHVLRGPQALITAEQWVHAALPDHATDILTDEAWPELAHLLHDLTATGENPVETLRTRADERRLEDDPHDPARSVAKVLHYRIVNCMPDISADANRPEFLPGWIQPPPEILLGGAREEERELAQWLRQRADQIAERVHELGERAAEQLPAWTAQLGQVPTDPPGRDWWVRRAGHVAAYRERWQVSDKSGELLPAGPGTQNRARKWVLNHLAHSVQPSYSGPDEPPAAVDPRVDHLRGQLEEVARVLKREPSVDLQVIGDPAEIELDMAAEPDDLGPAV